MDASTSDLQAGLSFTAAPPAGQPTGRYADVNGLHLYYERHGSGLPLVLLHGGLGSTSMFSGLLPPLAAARHVIAADLQAHGRTADIDRPLRYELMADDVAALIDQLGCEQVDLMGYSLGAGVALRAAIQHPGRVRKLVLISRCGLGSLLWRRGFPTHPRRQGEGVRGGQS